MHPAIEDIQKALAKYALQIPNSEVEKGLKMIYDSQQYFPKAEQHALIIKLLNDWHHRKNEKIIIIRSEACNIKHGPCVTTFGILSVDWPGFSDACLGIIHESGWNIYFVKGISMNAEGEELGIILIGVLTDSEEDHHRLTKQATLIVQKIKDAAVGTGAKTYLLAEETKKLEMYSQVIGQIESMYHEPDLDKIIGLNGEAVKYFAARSRDYIENRQTEDIARQILTNYSIMKNLSEAGSTIQLHIGNFKTKAEGVFTGVTVGGPARMLNLEDCLKTIAMTIPQFQLKHNREFTTEGGVSIFRIEFVDSANKPLMEAEQKRLRKSFDLMVLNKRRDRSEWIEAIGGFEHYSRAIIPLLVREAESSCKTQVYLSPGHMTDLAIDFKVIIVMPILKEKDKKAIHSAVNQFASQAGIRVLRVKPPFSFGASQVSIVDLRASLTEIEDTEAVYKSIKSSISKTLGEFRDFDEGMRTMDTSKLKAIRRRIKNIDKRLIRELYYSIEDFYRINTSEYEIISHIRLALHMLKTIDDSDESIIVQCKTLAIPGIDGALLHTASLLAVSYPHPQALLRKILEILDPYEVTLSRLEKTGRDILLCRLTLGNQALSEAEKRKLVKKIRKLGNGLTQPEA